MKTRNNEVTCQPCGAHSDRDNKGIVALCLDGRPLPLCHEEFQKKGYTSNLVLPIHYPPSSRILFLKNQVVIFPAFSIVECLVEINAYFYFQTFTKHLQKTQSGHWIVP